VNNYQSFIAYASQSCPLIGCCWFNWISKARSF